MIFTYLPTFEIQKKRHWCLIQTSGFLFNLFIYVLFLFFKYYFSPENQEIGTFRFLGVFKLGNRDSPGKKRDGWQVWIYRKKLYPLMVHPLTASSQVVS